MFGRLTDKAHQSIALSRDEARLRGHAWIGTEHLLLAMLGQFHDRDALGPHALRAGGADEHALRTRLLARFPAVGNTGGHDAPPGAQQRTPPGAPPGGPRFTPRMACVLDESLQLALGLGAEHVGTHHLLLGLLLETDCVAARVLHETGVTYDAVRDAVRAGAPALSPATEGLPAGPLEPATRLTVAAGRVARLAQALARQDGSGGVVGTDHYLRALAAERDGLAAEALASYGVDHPSMCERLAGADRAGSSDVVERRPSPRREAAYGAPVVIATAQLSRVLGALPGLLPPGTAFAFNVDGDHARIRADAGVDLGFHVARVLRDAAP